MHALVSLFDVPADPSLLVFGHYNPWLVTLSVAIAIFTSTLALQIAGVARQLSAGLHRQLAVGAGAIALGGGVWATHFIGMLAFDLHTAVRYAPWETGLSLVPALLASWITLRVLTRATIGPRQLVLGGMLVGGGIGAMHYSGMAALRMVPLLRYDLGWFALSIGVVMVLAALALWIRFGLRDWLGSSARSRNPTIVLSGIVMGVAIAGMHFLGMAAARFVVTPDFQPDVSAGGADTTALQVFLLVVMLSILVSVASHGLLRYRQIYQQMRASEAQHRSLLLHIPGLAYRRRLDAERKLVYISDGCLAITGWTASECLQRGHDFREQIHPDDRDRVRTQALQATQSFSSYETEYRLIHRDGSVRWMLSRGGVSYDEAGVPRWFDGLIMDMTQRHEMEEAMRLAKETAEAAALSKTTFLANMSHEIRTPMNAVIGFTELLLGTDLTALQRRHMVTVRQSARSLLGLLNSILDTAKLEKGAVELEDEDFSLKALVAQVADVLRLAAETKGLALEVDYQTTLGEFFRGDSLCVQQVLTNLMGNAVKFTQAGSVRLEVFDDAGQVHFAIHDTGIGIAPDRLEKIFEPFSQADASMTRRFGGTGLGTTIARQLVTLMGGTLQVQSAPGLGSVFRVLLPLKPGQAVAPKSDVLLYTLPPLRILAVDDVPQNLELLSLMLGQSGHQVSTAEDGHAALEAAASTPFDVILMDVQMPGMDGLETTRRLRQQEQARQVLPTPVVALTASVLESDRRAAQQAGMNGFSGKPLDLQHLMSEIARVLELPLAPSGPTAAGAAAILAPATAPSSDVLTIAWPRGIALWGTQETLVRAILRFLDDNRSAVHALADLVRSGNTQATQQLAHRLRGTAGNLCLERLHRQLGALEGCLRADTTAPMRLEQVHAVADGLAQVRQALMQHNAADCHDTGTTSAQAPSALDSATCSKLAWEALASAQRNQLNDSALDQLITCLHATGDSQRAAAIEEAGLAFEFDALQQQLQALLAWLAEQSQGATP